MGVGIQGRCSDGDREQVVILRVQVGHKEEEFLDGQGQIGAWVGTG